jgi:Ni/Fe-hydrogenase subunit HybB-like protein
MRTIQIHPLAQLALLVALVGAVVAAAMAQAPEIKRYLNVRAMS